MSGLRGPDSSSPLFLPVTGAAGGPTPGEVNGLRRWRWRRAAAVAGAGVARYAKLGDSISAGQGLQPSTQAPPVVMADMLFRRGVPVRGQSVIMNPKTRNQDARLTFSGSWTEYAASTLTTIASSDRVGDTVEFSTTITDSGDHVLRVLHLAGGQPFQIAVDGDSMAAQWSSSGAGFAEATVPLRGLSSGSHVIRITTSGLVHLASIGVEPLAGVTLCNFGISMSSTEDWVAGGAAFAPLQHVRAWGPDLAIIALMTNDANQGTFVAPESYAANLRAMVEDLADICDVVLEVQIPGDPAWVDLTPYQQAVYDIAESAQIPVLDLHRRWGSFAAADAAGVMSDAFHPNAIGAADIAAAEFDVVTS